MAELRPTDEQRAEMIKTLHLLGSCGRDGWGDRTGQRIDDCPYDKPERCYAYQQAVRHVDIVGPTLFAAGVEAARTAADDAVTGERAALEEVAKLIRSRECSYCLTPAQWISSPTGGWWSHLDHPADGHDAEPLEIDEDEIDAALALAPLLASPATDPDARPSIEELIERSSLGTPEAKAARDSVDPADAAEVVRRSMQADPDTAPVRCPMCGGVPAHSFADGWAGCPGVTLAKPSGGA